MSGLTHAQSMCTAASQVWDYNDSEVAVATRQIWDLVKKEIPEYAREGFFNIMLAPLPESTAFSRYDHSRNIYLYQGDFKSPTKSSILSSIGRTPLAYQDTYGWNLFLNYDYFTVLAIRDGYTVAKYSTGPTIRIQWIKSNI